MENIKPEDYENSKYIIQNKIDINFNNLLKSQKVFLKVSKISLVIAILGFF